MIEMMSAKEFDEKRIKSGVGIRELLREAKAGPGTYYYHVTGKGSGYWGPAVYRRFADALTRLAK